MKTQNAPKHLRAATRRWWESVVSEYVLEQHHVRLLTLAGEAWDRCAEAREILNREGLTYDDRFMQPKPRPELAVERDSRTAFARLVRELALDVAEPEETRPAAIRGKHHLKAS
jgi:P27 family predicted phage terminase small subunit